MAANPYPTLFTPLRIGNTTIRNRIFVAPMSIWHPSNKEAALAFIEERARGGAGVVTVSQAWVDTVHGKDSPDCGYPIDTDEGIPELAPFADAIRKHGAMPSLELQHAGAHSFQSSREGNVIYGPITADIAGGVAGHGETFHAEGMTDEWILGVIEAYGQAALRAKKAGFGMVLVHGGHGWLIHQFISPLTNTRTDRWGGSLENRCRLAVMICDRIKELCGPDFLIEFRMSVSELGTGYGVDTGIEIAKIMDDHVDLIHATCGRHEDPEYFVILHPSMFLEDGCNAHYAADLKAAGIKSPVVTVGAFSDPGLMEKTLASGGADAIAVARGVLADPALPSKARRGKAADIVQCVRCHLCQSELVYTSQFRCALNPAAGFEADLRHAPLPCTPQKVMVAGGGIAGMMAALTAADRGHKVTLVEREPQLGGVLRCEENVPFKKKQARFLAQQARRCAEHENIEILLGTPATAELAEQLQPDVIIVATGSRAKAPTAIKGAASSPLVVDAEELFADIDKAGQKVVLIGGGFVACELAIYLAMNGRDVTVLVRRDHLRMLEENFLFGEAITAQFGYHNVKLHLNTPIVEVNERGVVGAGPEGEQLFEADTVVCAVGRESNSEVWDELALAAPEVYAIGDVARVKDIQQANNQAFFLARDLGTIA